MKKASLLFLPSALLAVSAAMAAPVSPDEALARLAADRHLAPSVSNSVAQFSLTETVGNLYIFSGKTGYIVTPDDDCAPALLGYSDRSAFDADVNPNLAYWLEFLNGQLDYLKSNPQPAVYSAPSVARAEIAPMIETRWNQGSPYNNDCPVYNGSRCVTGCVATAMAQVLKYHGYPDSGTGTASYTWNNQQLSFDYGNTTFEWDEMTDVYDASSSAESMAAVAKLMYACGVSVSMNYSPSSSGAASIYIPGALIDHFNYDKAIYLAQRNAYGILDWEELIYNELKEGRPVLYGGQGSGGGHEFVCDGYSSDGYFHFNWGWGGLSDGYFLLTALNPGSLGTGGGAGGYNMDQDAVIGVMLPKAGSQPTYIMYNIEDFSAATTSVELGSTVEFSGAFMNGGATTLTNVTPGIKLQRSDDNSAQYIAAPYGVKELQTGYFFQAYDVNLPATLAEGEYIVTPAYKIGGGDWQDMRSYINVTGSQIAKVEGNNATFSAPERATVTVTDITTTGKYYIGRLTPMSFTITNPGTEEFVGEVIPSLLNESGTLTAQGDAIPVDLLGGASQQLSDVSVSFAALKGANFTAGNYSLVFMDGSRNTLSTPIDVTVAANPGTPTVSASAFDLVSAADKAAVKFNVGIRCSAGYCANSFRVVVFPYTSGSVTSVYSADTPVYYLDAGQSEEKTVSLDLTSLANGKYFAMLYSGSSQLSSKQIIFELTDPVTGIEEVEVEATTEEIYNLMGIKCSRPLAPGIYIINGVKTLVK